MVIQIRDLVPGADTAQQGGIVLPQLQAAMATGAPFVVSFDHIQTATSSFVNAAFVPLLQIYSFSAVKQQMRVVKSTRQINEMIRSRLQRVSMDAAA